MHLGAPPDPPPGDPRLSRSGGGSSGESGTRCLYGHAVSVIAAVTRTLQPGLCREGLIPYFVGSLFMVRSCRVKMSGSLYGSEVIEAR